MIKIGRLRYLSAKKFIGLFDFVYQFGNHGQLCPRKTKSSWERERESEKKRDRANTEIERKNGSRQWAEEESE